MRSSDVLRAVVFLATLFAASSARAEPAAQGFAVERFQGAPPGAGWLVMDALDTKPGLGGAMATTFGYSHAPLKSGSLEVVSDRLFAGFGFAASYDNVRLSLGFEMPLWVTGDSGVARGYAYQAPSIDPGSHPDTLSDARVGLDVRLLGEADGPYRLGIGAQLFVPNGVRSDYTTDDTYRAMFRGLFAGDVGGLSYAGHLGVHVRPLDDPPAPGSAAGSELLFGIAAGPRLHLGGDVTAVIGPEIWGESALHDFLAEKTTGVEGMLTGRVEGAPGPAQLRLKLGAGGGLNARFGAPELRSVLSIEVAGQAR